MRGRKKEGGDKPRPYGLFVVIVIEVVSVVIEVAGPGLDGGRDVQGVVGGGVSGEDAGNAIGRGGFGRLSESDLGVFGHVEGEDLSSR